MQKLDDLVQKEMTRKEFITTLAFGAATVFGFSTVLELLGKSNPLHKRTMGNVASYSSGYYSGFKKS